MTDKEKDFRGFAAKLLAEIYDVEELPNLYLELVEVDEVFKKVPLEKFQLEYLCAELALGAVYWLECCAENKLGDQDKLFLQSVMDSFKSEKFVEIATLFSVYLQESGVDQEASGGVAIAKQLFKRLELGHPTHKKDGKEEIRPLFNAFMQVFDGMCAKFDSDFLDFLYG